MAADETRQWLLSLYRDAVTRCHAGDRVADFLASTDDGNALFGNLGAPASTPLRLLAIGKAAPAMLGGFLRAIAPLEHLRIEEAVCVTDHLPRPTPRNLRDANVELLSAAHPIPDENSLAAGKRAIELVADANPLDTVVVLLSGGASSLCEWPRVGITLEDLAQTHRALLRSGATIDEINVVRAALSQIKGGALAARCHASRLITLIVSDVCGNDLRVIGSGPTVPANSSQEWQYKFDGTYGMPYRPPPRAADIVRDYGLAADLPPAVLGILRATRDRPQTDTHTTCELSHHLVATPESLAEAARLAALNHPTGVHVMAAPEPLASDAATFINHYAANVRNLRGHTGKGTRGFLHIMAAEPTLRVTGDGTGGRCQHVAAMLARELAGVPGWAFLAAGSDGRDGPTDFAGALVDGSSYARARANGGDPDALIESFDSTRFHALAETHIARAHTSTNVADLHLLYVA